MNRVVLDSYNLLKLYYLFHYYNSSSYLWCLDQWTSLFYACFYKDHQSLMLGFAVRAFCFEIAISKRNLTAFAFLTAFIFDRDSDC
jgi:hypothetical protein